MDSKVTAMLMKPKPTFIVRSRIQRTSIFDSYHASTVSIGGWPLTDSNSTATKHNLSGSVQRGKLRRVQSNSLPVSGVSVVPSVVERNLGVYVDGELSMKDHINKLARTCFFQLRQLRTIRRSLTKEATRLLLHAFVVSRLDYWKNALFTGLPFQSLGRLQLIQNADARLFGGLRKYDHVTATMKSELHWLRIPERINFKLSTLVYKALHGEGPA